MEWGGDRGCSLTARPLSPPKHPPFCRMGGGGGQGVFTVSLPKHGTARSLSPPSPTSCPGQINVAQARHCTSSIPPEEPALHGMRGGRQGVFAVARRPRTALRLSPPRKTHHTCNGGGGDRGCSTAVHVAYPSLPHVAYPPHTPRRLPPPTPPPPICPGKIKIKNETYLFGVYQKRQTTH